MLRQLIGGLAGFSVIVLVGCSGDSGVEAKGHLTWEEDGKPISSANLRCVPKETGRPEVIGITGKDGEFSLSTLSGKSGAPRGEYTVLVTQVGGADTSSQTGAMSPEEMIKAMQAAKEKLQKAGKSEIPAIYSDPGKSPLKLTITGANTKIELKLKKT